MTTISKEIILDKTKVIMSKTDAKGLILYANNYFLEISGYNRLDLLGEPHNIIRHPDMPKIIFKVLWDKLHKGESLYAVVKNVTKNGDYYWVVTKFETTFDENGKIISHFARRKAVPQKVKETAESIYKIILEIEKHDEKLAEDTFYEILDDYGLSYDDFFKELSGMNDEEINHFFLSAEMNTNATAKNIVKAIEIEEEKLKEEEEEEVKLTPISTNFLGELDELKDLKSLLKKKNSLE